MTPAKVAIAVARAKAHDIASVAVHAAARFWEGGRHDDVAKELRAIADAHTAKANLYRQMVRDG